MTSERATTLEDVRIGGSRIVLEPHNCFACGSLNVHGLQLELHAGNDRCWTELELDRRFEGWDGIAHGGIVCTILDEVMAWALVDHDLWGVTARMNVDFKRPVPIGRRIRGEGRVVDTKRRVVYAEGVIVDALDGTTLARAQATFVGAPDARKDELKQRYGFRLEPDAGAAGTPDTGDTPAVRDTSARTATALAERAMTTATVSPTTVRARAFVADRKAEAVQLGREAGDLVGDPIALAALLTTGLEQLADPEYREGMDRVAPGIGPILGVRQPLLRAVGRGLRGAMRRDRSSTVLDIAGHLLRRDLLELQWLAFGLLERTIREDPEQTWQLVRAAARRADNWVTVDTLAHVVARGIVGEPYRWAELEQLVYSPSRWERRLVGSTIAVLPVTDHTLGRTPEVARHGLAILGDLMGDSEADVQKALSWALRSMSGVDLPATVAFLRAEARTAAATDDGHRAWVIRDSLEKLPQHVAAELRAAIDGIRKRPGAPSTSRAARTAADFIALGVTVPPADRPIVERA